MKYFLRALVNLAEGGLFAAWRASSIAKYIDRMHQAGRPTCVEMYTFGELLQIVVTIAVICFVIHTIAARKVTLMVAANESSATEADTESASAN